jgi:hypothetical protein
MERLLATTAVEYSELTRQAYSWFETSNNHFLDMRRSFAKVACSLRIRGGFI